jgi:hypothetical protein
MRVANQLALEAEARGARPKLSVTIVAQNDRFSRFRFQRSHH